MSSAEKLGSIESILRTAGLIDAAHQFPDDMLAAAQTAARVRATLPPPTDNAQEPWPPMRVRVTSCTG